MKKNATDMIFVAKDGVQLMYIAKIKGHSFNFKIFIKFLIYKVNNMTFI